jgi:mono/diheme cytochrome c family protein
VIRMSSSRLAVAWVGLCCVAGACAGEAAESETAVAQGETVGAAAADPAADSAVAIAQGQALYGVHCIGCHGPEGRGDGPLAANLPVQPANFVEHLGEHTDADLVLSIVAGIPPVMPPAAISPEEVENVLAYIWSIYPDTLRLQLRAAQFLMMEEAH